MILLRQSFSEILHGSACFNCSITNKSMFLFNSSTKCNFLAYTCTDWICKLDFHDILKLNKYITSLTSIIFPEVYVDPTLNFNISSASIFCIFTCFFSPPCVLTPNNFFIIEN